MCFHRFFSSLTLGNFLIWQYTNSILLVFSFQGKKNFEYPSTNKKVSIFGRPVQANTRPHKMVCLSTAFKGKNWNSVHKQTSQYFWWLVWLIRIYLKNYSKFKNWYLLKFIKANFGSFLYNSQDSWMDKVLGFLYRFESHHLLTTFLQFSLVPKFVHRGSHMDLRNNTRCDASGGTL